MLPQHIEQQIYHLPKSPKKSESNIKILTGLATHLSELWLQNSAWGMIWHKALS
tara:strand:+ start:449 stop:610 length:162 start_codon:yes stop_codon:yes gene_type:complete